MLFLAFARRDSLPSDSGPCHPAWVLTLDILCCGVFSNHNCGPHHTYYIYPVKRGEASLPNRFYGRGGYGSCCYTGHTLDSSGSARFVIRFLLCAHYPQLITTHTCLMCGGVGNPTFNSPTGSLWDFGHYSSIHSANHTSMVGSSSNIWNDVGQFLPAGPSTCLLWRGRSSLPVPSGFLSWPWVLCLPFC